jgi:hypothetical protein
VAGLVHGQSRVSSATADFLGAGVVDEVLAGGGCGDERGDGGVVERAGQPVGDPVQPGDRVVGEQRLVADLLTELSGIAAAQEAERSRRQAIMLSGMS